MSKIIGIGETIYNVTMKNGSPINGMPGGDVFNTMISVGRLGVDASLISEVADDRLGRQILDFMRDNGVNTDYMYSYHEGRTPLSLSHLSDDGNAEYDYYVMYPTTGRLDVVWPRIDDNDIVYLGSRYVLVDAVHNVVMDLVNFAEARKALIVYTPDVHKLEQGQSIWLMPKIIDCLEKANIIMMSTSDMSQLYKDSNPESVYQNNVRFYCPTFIAWQQDSIYLRTAKIKKVYPAPDYSKEKNLIGVKDAFSAGLLYELNQLGATRQNLDMMTEDQWDQIIEKARSCAAEVAASPEAFVQNR